MSWLLVLACTGSPTGADGTCAQLSDPLLVSECVFSALESSATPSATLCRPLVDSAAQECHFRLAERTDNPAYCVQAGAQEDSCRLHLYSQRMPRWLSDDVEFQDIAMQAPPHMSAVGLSAEDPRAWSATWRAALSARAPLDRGACDSLEPPMVREACRHTGIALFQDQLTRAASLGQDLCEGQLSPTLAPAPDPELDEVLARRRTQDLCAPSKLPPPSPGAGLP